MTTELLKNVKKEVRDITFLLKDTSPSEAKSEICNNLAMINSNIKKKLETIMNKTATNVRNIVVERSKPHQPLIEEKNDVIELGVILNRILDPENLRIIINFEAVHIDNVNDAIRKDPNRSHIIEIKHGTANNITDDMNNYESSATLYLPKTSKILSVIEDVMLDISLYHTFIGANEKIPGFNRIKIEHIKEWGLKAENWDTETHKEYVSIAGYYKKADADDFDALNYVHCWISLAKKVLGTDKLPIKPITEQLSRHRKHGQLNIKNICIEYDKLFPGKYYLVRVDRVPKTSRAQSQLLPLFGGSGEKLTVGKTRFYLINEISVFKNLETYVSFFIVEK